jgi:hypothetical protein
MIEKKEIIEPTAETPLPNSRKVYVAGELHAALPHGFLLATDEHRFSQMKQDEEIADIPASRSLPLICV